MVMDLILLYSFISKNLLALPMLDYFLQAYSSVLSLFIAYAMRCHRTKCLVNITEKINISTFLFMSFMFLSYELSLSKADVFHSMQFIHPAQKFRQPLPLTLDGRCIIMSELNCGVIFGGGVASVIFDLCTLLL